MPWFISSHTRNSLAIFWVLFHQYHTEKWNGLTKISVIVLVLAVVSAGIHNRFITTYVTTWSNEMYTSQLSRFCLLYQVIISPPCHSEDCWKCTRAVNQEEICFGVNLLDMPVFFLFAWHLRFILVAVEGIQLCSHHLTASASCMFHVTQPFQKLPITISFAVKN